MKSEMRVESDFLGSREIPAVAYYGIHALRASENFAVSGRRLPRGLIRALALVKQAAAMAHGKSGEIEASVAGAIRAACEETAAGRFDLEFIVDPLQGGAGTAANMNANEVIANRANELLGSPPGSYRPVNPLNEVNRGQSTNDVFPTSIRIAAIWELRDLVDEVARLQDSLQKKETEFAPILKIGRTQLQDAVPITLGAEFSAYAEAVSRDRWRLYRSEERLRVVNLGGTAVGTGITTTRKFQFETIAILRELTGIGLARAENPIEATQNADVFCEISGLLKPLAVNLSKMAGDLRLLASGPRSGIGEIRLPAVQEGSSIMPGKVNPVMCEMVSQIAMKVYGNDLVITHAAESGQLELNAFLPVIADVLLESLMILRRGISLFNDRCVKGVEADRRRCRENLRGSLGLLTVLATKLGHDAMSQVYQRHLRTGDPVPDILIGEGLATAEEIEAGLDSYRAE